MLAASLTLSEHEEAHHRKRLADKCRNSYEEFVRYFWDSVPNAQPLVWNWHMSLICSEVQKVYERVFAGLPAEYDLIFNLPPGSSKSTLVTILPHPWSWTRMPGCRHHTMTHTLKLVLELASHSRDVIRSEKYQMLFPNIEIREDTDAKGMFRNTYGGDRFACTASGASPTGWHYHVATVDDLIDPKKAASVVELANCKRFITDTLWSRKLKLVGVDQVTKKTGYIAAIIMVMQRLHRDDPTGIVVANSKREGARPVKLFSIPAELTDKVHPPELRQFYVDGLFNPSMFPRSALMEAKASTTSYSYNAQFLQDPTQPEGSMFKEHWFKQLVRFAPYECVRVRYWDTASTKDGGCYTAGVLLAKDKEGRYYVEHVVHGQWDTDERNQIMLETAIRDRNRYGKHEPRIVIEREGGGSGKDAYLSMCRILDGFSCSEDLPSGPKDTRAQIWVAPLAAMNVYLVDDGSWDVEGYVQEHLSFAPEGAGKRLGKYKDQVDASVGAHSFLSKRHQAGTLHVYPVGKKKQGLQLMSWDSGQQLILDEQHWLMDVIDPWEILVEPENNPNRTRRLVLKLADIDPKDWQECWDKPSESLHGRKPSEVALTRDEAKKLWSFLLKPGEKPPTVICVRDAGGRRAASVCKAMAETLRLDWKPEPDQELNRHVVETVKAARNMVIG